MLKFITWVNTLVDPKKLYWMYMDTDCFYCALSEDTLLECIKPENVPRFKKEQSLWFPKTGKQFHSHIHHLGVQYDLTEEQFDRRTTGKFKIEYEGTGGICLGPKSTLWWGSKPLGSSFPKSAGAKASMKGAVNSLVYTDHREHLPALRQSFFDALFLRSQYSVQNRGIRRIGKEMVTYGQDRRVLNFFFDKAVVASDLITVSPLSL
jgi:hypothetical protein